MTVNDAATEKINRRDNLLAVLRGEKTGVIPWVPFAGVHAGRLVGCNATEVLTDVDKLVRSLLEVNRLYTPCGQPVAFDLQIEAEILGCELVWADDGPPSVKTHPLETSKEIPCACMLPEEGDGRLPIVLEATRRLKDAVGGETAIYGLVCGPFTLASHLRGNEIFMDMFDDEDYVKALVGFCAEAAKRVAKFYAEAGADVVAVVDPLVSQISSSHFEDFLSEPFSDVFAYIRSLGLLSSFFVCGNATRNIEVMCHTRPDSISVDENVDLVAAKEICGRYNIAAGGNIPLTSVMLHGTQQDNMKYVTDLLDAIGNTDGLIVSPGCDMPYAIPVENTIAAAQAALHPESAREMLKNYTAPDDGAAVELPDYQNLPRTLVEVFTLDSATCAACTYMMEAATVAADHFGEKIDMIEYKYTVKENIARCRKMGVKNLPSIYINGKLHFSSIIPRREELFAAIEGEIASLGR